MVFMHTKQCSKQMLKIRTENINEGNNIALARFSDVIHYIYIRHRDRKRG